MRKLLPIIAIAAAAAVATPAFAYQDDRYPVQTYVAPVAGAAVGTAVGVGLYNGWFSGSLAAALPATAAGAAVVGGLAGIGTIVVIDAFTQRCRGLGPLWTPREQCADGEWIGNRPVRMHRTSTR